MFTADEGEGWQQLGEGLMPSSSKDAGVMLEGFHKIGEQTVGGLLGQTSMPDLKDALGAMFGSKPVQVGELPKVDFFDSGSSAAISGAEAVPGAEPSGMMQAGAGGGTVETLQTVDSNLQATAGGDSVSGLSDATSPLGDIGKAVTDLVGKMTDMFGTLAQGPMGLLGSLLNFLLTVFTEILSSIGTAVAETARAAASLAAEAWKKHLEATV